jgi:hypothetical protein
MGRSTSPAVDRGIRRTAELLRRSRCGAARARVALDAPPLRISTDALRACPENPFLPPIAVRTNRRRHGRGRRRLYVRERGGGGGTCGRIDEEEQIRFNSVNALRCMRCFSGSRRVVGLPLSHRAYSSHLCNMETCVCNNAKNKLQ